jgi:methylmalonyl-CoA/ethylmalonyl-CoA epimerase
MINGVYHLGYLTDNLEAAKAFYQDALGATVLLESDNPASGSKMAFLQVGGTQVELIEPADKARLDGRTGLIFDHVGYTVDSLEREIVQLAANGLRFATTEPRVNPEGAQLIYLDASTTLGARIHLTERTNQSKDR